MVHRRKIEQVKRRETKTGVELDSLALVVSKRSCGLPVVASKQPISDQDDLPVAIQTSAFALRILHR
jgi:hypothetical protein